MTNFFVGKLDGFLTGVVTAISVIGVISAVFAVGTCLVYHDEKHENEKKD